MHLRRPLLHCLKPYCSSLALHLLEPFKVYLHLGPWNIKYLLVPGALVSSQPQTARVLGSERRS